MEHIIVLIMIIILIQIIVIVIIQKEFIIVKTRIAGLAMDILLVKIFQIVVTIMHTVDTVIQNVELLSGK